MKKSFIVFVSFLVTVLLCSCKKSNNKIADTSLPSLTHESSSNISYSINDSETSFNQTENNNITHENEGNIQSNIKVDTNSSENYFPSDQDKELKNGYEIYQKGLDMYSKVLLRCPYELDFDNTDENGYAMITDKSINGINDIISLYCTVFAEPDEYIYERYNEYNGSVYCSDASRGTNIYYMNTDLEFISGDETEQRYKAVSHYSNPETGEAMDDKISDFTIKLINGSYKITEFSFPK